MKHRIIGLFLAVLALTLLCGCGDDEKSKVIHYEIGEDAFTLGSYSLSEDGRECTVIFYCRNSLDSVTASVTYLDREGKEIGSDSLTKPISFSSTTSDHGELTFSVPDSLVGKIADLRAVFTGTSQVNPAYSVGWHTVTFSVDGQEFSRQTVQHGSSASLPTDLPEKSYGIFTGWVDEEGNAFDFSTPVIHNTEVHAVFAPGGEEVANITVAVKTEYETAGGESLTASGVGILFYRSDKKNRYYLLTAESLVHPSDAVSASYTVTDTAGNSYEALTFPVMMDGETQEDFDARVDACFADAAVTGLAVLYFASEARENLSVIESTKKENPAVDEELFAIGWKNGTSSIAVGTVTAYSEQPVQTENPKCSFTGNLPILEFTTDAEGTAVGGGLMSLTGLAGVVLEVQASGEDQTRLLVAPIATVMKFLNTHVFS